MTTWKIWQTLSILGALTQWLALASSAVAQTSDISGERIGGMDPGVPFKQQLSSDAIGKLLETPIETKAFQEPMTLEKFLERMQQKLPAKAKTLRFVIDTQAFKEDEPATSPVTNTQVKLPPFPKRMSLATVLRLAASKIPSGNATYWVRRGQIVITTIERAESLDANELLKHPVTRSFERRPLIEVLDELSDITGVAIVLDRRVADKARVLVTAKIQQQGMTLGTALRLLTDMTDLQCVMIDNIAYVTTPSNAKKLEKENALRRTPLIGCGGAINPWGEPYTRGSPVKFTFRQRPLAQALDDLAVNSWFAIVLDRRVADRTQVGVTARTPNSVTLEGALTVLTDMAGLRHVVLEDAVYVTSPANAQIVAAALGKRRAAVLAKNNMLQAK